MTSTATARETVATRRTKRGAYAARAAAVRDDVNYLTGSYGYVVEQSGDGFWNVVKVTR